MKLSQLSTDESLDVLCEITPYICSISTDDELTAELKRKVDPNDVKTKAGLYLEGTKKITTLIPILLKTHRNDVYGILAAINQKDIEEIGRQNVLVTAVQIREAVKDKDLVNFFKSCVNSESDE